MKKNNLHELQADTEGGAKKRKIEVYEFQSKGEKKKKKNETEKRRGK